jgi:hypothetical protein
MDRLGFRQKAARSRRLACDATEARSNGEAERVGVETPGTGLADRMSQMAKFDRGLLQRRLDKPVRVADEYVDLREIG